MINPDLIRYPIDTTGIHPDNRITNERHEITPTKRTIVPRQRYFYGESLVVALNGVELKLGTQYRVDDMIPELTQKTSKAIMSTIVITDDTVMGEVVLDYQCYGTGDQFTRTLLADLVNQANSRQDIHYKNIIGLPEAFTPSPHRHPVTETYGWRATVHLFNEMVDILSNWRLLRDGSMYAKIAEIQDLLNDRISGFQRDLADARVSNNVINGLDNKVDEAIARLKQEVSALSSVQDMQNLMNRVKNELTDAYKLADTNLDDKLSRGYRTADSALSDRIDALTTRVDELSTSDELNRRFNQYVPLTTYNRDKSTFATVANITTINEALGLRPTTTAMNQAIAEAVRQVPWDRLTSVPRLWTDKNTGNTSKDFNTYASFGTYYVDGMTGHTPLSLSRDYSGILKVYESASDVWQFFTEKNGTTWSRTGVRNGQLISRWTNWESSSKAATRLRPDSGDNITNIYSALSDKTCGYYTFNAPFSAIGMADDRTSRNGIPRPSDVGDWAVINISALDQRTIIASSGYRNHYICTKDNPSEQFHVERIMTDLILKENYPRIWNVGTELDALKQSVAAAANNTEHINQLRQEVGRGYVPLSRVQTNLYDHAVDKIPKYTDQGYLGATAYQIGTSSTNSKSLWYDNGSVHLNALFKPENIQLTSDANLKKDIVPIENPEDIICGISGYKYRFKKDNREAVGVIAQEVELVLPEAVSQDSSGTRSVDYNAIVAVLVETVKSQQLTIDILKSRLEKLEDIVGK